MSELADYLLTLKKRGLSIAMRELKSRFIRQSPVSAIRRIMDLCEKYDSVFTFYITGNTAMREKDFIAEILGRGHSIECHGFNHIRFDLKPEAVIRQDIKTAKMLYQKQFNHTVRGFRAPYLKLNDTLINILKDEGFVFSSSTMGDISFKYACGLTEMPISICDWHILIKDNSSHDQMLSKMLAHQKDGAVFELHPWRMGQKGYVEVIKKFLKQKTFDCISQLRLYEESRKSIALTGDVGELGFGEIVQRIFSASNYNYEKVLRQLNSLS
jgi:peptidoglycan/xylan/chitin deacetylase (PgdA/CDA1 family)